MFRPLKALLVAAAATAASCIPNDIPYPVVEITIASVEGEGFALAASDIDLRERTVTLTLDETTDIRRLRIDRVGYDLTVHSLPLDPEALTAEVRTSTPLVGTHDLRTPLYTTLSLYQNYDWTIRARQTIERSFTVAGQIGATVFDLEKRIATAYVSKDADLTQVAVASLKLGPAGITEHSPALEELGSDFRTVRFVDVTCHGRTERWMLYVLHTDKSVELKRIDPWSGAIWLYGEGIAGQDLGFRYRKKGTEAWLEAPAKVDGGSFSACVAAEPETTYEVKAYCGDEETDPEEATTEAVVQLPNSGFEEWATIDGIVCPYLNKETRYWGTGNPGAALAGTTLTQGLEDPRPGSEGRLCAHLKSKKATIGGVGKFAAGNLFLGAYAATNGTNGIIEFGRAFDKRPTGLKIRVKYVRGLIDELTKVPVGSGLKKGDPDNGIVYIAVGTWSPEVYGLTDKNVRYGSADSPVVVDTRDVSTFFQAAGPDVIGYGEQIFGDRADWQDLTEWQELVIPIRYTATDVVPTNLMIVCSASRWGDYFTGGTASEMWLDDFELLYEPLDEQ